MVHRRRKMTVLLLWNLSNLEFQYSVLREVHGFVGNEHAAVEMCT
jgi:hypothetical protein